MSNIKNISAENCYSTIKENKDDFENIGAIAIQGSANKLNNE